jgi:hypothetical protein
MHINNMVVVLRSQDNIEEGKYICLVTFSDCGTEIDGLKFSQQEYGVRDYKRVRSH